MDICIGRGKLSFCFEKFLHFLCKDSKESLSFFNFPSRKMIDDSIDSEADFNMCCYRMYEKLLNVFDINFIMYIV